jgi:hypothetical protein
MKVRAKRGASRPVRLSKREMCHLGYPEDQEEWYCPGIPFPEPKKALQPIPGSEFRVAAPLDKSR